MFLACFSHVSRVLLAFCSRGMPYMGPKRTWHSFCSPIVARPHSKTADSRISIQNGNEVARPPCQFFSLWRGAEFVRKWKSCGATSLPIFVTVARCEFSSKKEFVWRDLPANNESVDSITNYLTKNQPIIYNNTTYISLTLTQIVLHINPLSSRKNRYVSKNVPFCDQNGNEVARPPCQTFHSRISIVKGYTVARPPCNNFRTA